MAHHQDDLFENFFIRILRGSGLKGLTSFDEKTKINNVNILRPLLNQKKDDMLFVSNFVFRGGWGSENEYEKPVGQADP